MYLLDELAPGEEPRGFRSSGTDEPDVLEQAVLDDMGRLLGIPPESLTLRFEPNYGTTASALAAFKVYLETVRDTFGEDFARRRYVDWLRTAWCLTGWRPDVNRVVAKAKEEEDN
jgi:hypothetical protein